MHLSRTRNVLATTVFAGCLVALLNTPVESRAATTIETVRITCPALDVRSLSTTVQPWSALPDKPTPEILVSPPSGKEQTANGAKQDVVASGPILGSMDFSKVDTNLACTSDGVAIEAFVTRSDQYFGDVRKNAPWRPRIVIRLWLKRAAATLKVVWKMRLTNGALVTHATTPGYQEQDFPIILVKQLSVPDR